MECIRDLFYPKLLNHYIQMYRLFHQLSILLYEDLHMLLYKHFFCTMDLGKCFRYFFFNFKIIHPHHCLSQISKYLSDKWVVLIRKVYWDAWTGLTRMIHKCKVSWVAFKLEVAEALSSDFIWFLLCFRFGEFQCWNFLPEPWFQFKLY